VQVPADRATDVIDRLAAAYRAGLATGPDEQRGLALARGLALTSRDVGELGGWLDSDRTGQGHELDATLRWTVVHRLAGLGAFDADHIEEERQRDGSSVGDLGAATALAARPTGEAKADAWSSMTDEVEISNRRFGALAAGLWSPEQAELLAAYVPAYVEAAPRLARRGSAFAASVGSAFPALHLDDDQLELVRAALRADVPPVLRRAWEDALDDRS